MLYLNSPNGDIPVELRINPRAKHVRLTVYPDGKVVAACPKGIDRILVEKFLTSKTKWILSKVLNYQKINFANRNLPKINLDKDKILSFVESRLKHYNQFYGFIWKSVRIKNHKSLWGSCSRIGNLNFNIKIGLLLQELADYIIVHELCHLKEFNHSENFWKLVSQKIPDYKKIRAKLKAGNFNYE